jgi:hypothetical protein
MDITGSMIQFSLFEESEFLTVYEAWLYSRPAELPNAVKMKSAYRKVEPLTIHY